MNKGSIKKISIVSTVILVLCVVIGFGIYKYNKIQTYNNLITSANGYMKSKEYDEAIALFNQSLNYKNDADTNKQIKLAEKLKKLNAIYNDGLGLQKDKKYLDAIAELKKITNEDKDLYSKSQKSIEECKKQYILDNINSANEAFKNSNYDDANKYLGLVLKIDDKNQQAKNLQSSIVKAKAEQEAQAKQNQLIQAQNQQKANEVAAYNQSQNDYNNKMAELQLEIKQCDYDVLNGGNSQASIQALERKKELMQQALELSQKQLSIDEQYEGKH